MLKELDAQECDATKAKSGGESRAHKKLRVRVKNLKSET